MGGEGDSLGSPPRMRLNSKPEGKSLTDAGPSMETSDAEGPSRAPDSSSVSEALRPSLFPTTLVYFSTQESQAFTLEARSCPSFAQKSLRVATSTWTQNNLESAQGGL